MPRWLSGPKPDFLVLALLGGLTVIVGLVAAVRDLLGTLFPHRHPHTSLIDRY